MSSPTTGGYMGTPITVIASAFCLFAIVWFLIYYRKVKRGLFPGKEFRLSDLVVVIILFSLFFAFNVWSIWNHYCRG